MTRNKTIPLEKLRADRGTWAKFWIWADAKSLKAASKLWSSDGLFTTAADYGNIPWESKDAACRCAFFSILGKRFRGMGERAGGAAALVRGRS